MILKAAPLLRLLTCPNSSSRAFVRDLQSSRVHKADESYPKLNNIHICQGLNGPDSESRKFWTSSLKSGLFYSFVVKGVISLVIVSRPAVALGGAYSSPYQSDAFIFSNVKVSNFFEDLIFASASESRYQKVQDERYPELASSESFYYAGSSGGAEESEQEANDGGYDVDHGSENLPEETSRDENSANTPVSKQEGTELTTGQNKASIIMQVLTEASQPR